MVDFANIPVFNPDLRYEFAIVFSLIEDDGTEFYRVLKFQHLLDEAGYNRLAEFLTTNDDIPLYDNPVIAFQDEMEGEYGDLGVGDSGVDNQFIRFENEDTGERSDQLSLLEHWRRFFADHGFESGPIEEKQYSAEDFDEDAL